MKKVGYSKNKRNFNYF